MQNSTSKSTLQGEKEMSDNKPFIVKSHDVHLDSDYRQWLSDLKSRYHRIQIKAALKINSEQLLFNWQLGRDLVVRRAEEKWGKGIVEQVSLDLQAEFPNVKGFSARNLWNLKRWYSFYAYDPAFPALIGAIEQRIQEQSKKLHQLGAEIKESKLQQVAAEIEFPSLFAYVPWGHHVEIVTKCKTINEALFYIAKTIDAGYSRSVLVNMIEADLFHKEGKALTNYLEKLPETQGKLAQEIIRSNYDLGFITLPANYDEKALETALEQNITRFLLELGVGFSFVGRQKELVVSGTTRSIDLLFYHIRLRCYVAVELKVKSFEPEYAGKLNFYVSAVDELLKTENENPTIGLLICKDMDSTEVKWSFRNIGTPMGVATYSNIQIEEMEQLLPSAEQIKKRIDQAQEEYNRNKQEKLCKC